MPTILSASRTVLGRPWYRLLAAAGFVGFTFLYLITLPATYTGGRIGLVGLRYLTPELAAIALFLGAALGLATAFMAYAWRQHQGISAGTAAGGAFVGLVTPLLCCSPLLPSALAFVAASFPVLAGTAAGSVQGFIATNELAILLGAAALVTWALYRNARRVVAGAACSVPARGSSGNLTASDNGPASAQTGSRRRALISLILAAVFVVAVGVLYAAAWVMGVQ